LTPEGRLSMVPPMRRLLPRPRPASALAGAVRTIIAAACLCGATVWAEPAADAPAVSKASTSTNTAAPGDRIAHFLGERGLVPAPTTEPSIARQVRDRAADWTSDLVLSAMNFLGVRYRRGGNTADEGFDCSGFTRHVFEASIGLVLPRRANEQAKANTLEPVKREQLKPGDLVFFNTLRSAFSHVGIYVGDGKFIHAPRTGGEVRVEDMRIAYWSKRFNGARRAVAPDDAVVATPVSTTAAVKATASKGGVANPENGSNASAKPLQSSDAAAGSAATPGIVY
jgi:cell wall-associated NlpC family hydrolase